MGSVKKAVKKAVKNPVKTLLKVNPVTNNIVTKATGLDKTRDSLAGTVDSMLPGAGSNQQIQPYGSNYDMSAAEAAAGAGLSYEALRDPATGELKSEFKYDPTKSAAFSELQKQAMAAPGESPWAKMQMEKQALEQSGQTDLTAKQQAQALAQAQSGLARTGGLSSGARTRLAAQGAKDLMLAQQGVAGQGIKDRLGIGEQDINRQQQLLGNISATELEGQSKNIGTGVADVESKRAFDLDRYKTQMALYGAGKTAKAQERAAQASGGKK